ncbi:MAG TPA: serine/threonine-protein kinase [Rhodothermales bacterium]|nr:serine/threonine-protein kinase [Rhodothermales bacterium]
MTSSAWTHIKDLLNEALALAPEARSAFLDSACADATLRQEVAALLDAHEQAEAAHALESPFDSQDDLSPIDTSEQATENQRVGPYRLGRLLGRGGMGNVYLAERADGQFQQTVALKLIRRGLDTDDILSRFAFERQILSGLEHPNIARLYDGGITENGRPYFAMEYVEGEPITAYCDHARLTTPQRLALFRTVCRAVQHAHQNLVVHRDLKPSNILVTEDAEVKLLDFGIAKLLSEEGATRDLAMPRTRTGMQVLTPEYAAPEQVRGETITTATDVYQLGVLLYELLTGHRPYRIPSRVQHEIARVILEEEPERPSTAVRRTTAAQTSETRAVTPETVSQARSTDPGRLQRRLVGDLDTIVLTALKKEPSRRYASVEQLAEDVRRHLHNLPVTARPDTFGYRASRFVRRNRVSVAATGAVTLALIIGLGTALWQSQIATEERDRAEVALAQAEGTLDYLGTTILAGGPYEGDPETPIGTVLDSAAAYVDEDLAETPVVAGAVHQTLTKVYLERGLPDRAAHHARRARALAADEHDPAYAKATAQLATALSDAGKYEEALPFHEEAVHLLREAEGEETNYATALNGYAATLSGIRREEEAEQAYLEAIAIHQATDDPTAALRPLNNLAVLYSEQGRYEDAAQSLREVVATLRAGGTRYHLATALINLAGSLNFTGEVEESLQLYREGVQMLRDELGNEHPETIMAQVSLGNHYFAMDDLAAAQREAAIGLEAALSALGPDHFITAYAQNVAGHAYCKGGDAPTGEPLLRASLETRRTMLPEGHWLLANGESLLGGCLAQLGRNQEAEVLLEQSFVALLSDRGPEHQKTIEARDRLLAFYETTGQTEQAAALKAPS